MGQCRKQNNEDVVTMKLELPPGAKLVPCGKGHRIVYADESVVTGQNNTSGGSTDCDVQECEAQMALGKQGEPCNPTLPKARKSGSRPDRRSPNKTESLYMVEKLGTTDTNSCVMYEAIKLRLDDGTFYVPDFVVTGEEMPELHEVKAPHRFAEKGRLKWRWAKQLYGHIFRFVFAMRVKGGWRIEE